MQRMFHRLAAGSIQSDWLVESHIAESPVQRAFHRL